MVSGDCGIRWSKPRPMYSRLFGHKTEGIVFPRIGFYANFLREVFKRFGILTLYRGEFLKELMSDRPSDLFYESLKALEKFVNAAVTDLQVEGIAKNFFLNPQVLLSAGRELIFKNMKDDFSFAFQVAKGQIRKETQVIFPFPKIQRALLCRLLGIEKEYPIAAVFSSMGFFIERLKLIAIILLKAGYVGWTLIYWRYTKTSRLAQDLKGHFLWVPGGPTEISLDPQRLSLPLYLEEILKSGKFPTRRFAVLCPFLDKKKYWETPHSFAVPQLRKIPPGLSHHHFCKEMRNLFRLLGRLFIAGFKTDTEIELLSLLPQVFLNRMWLKSIPVEALFITESCAGAAYPLAHAAREVGIPVIMVFYSADVSPIVIEKSNQNVVPLEFKNMLADHLCLWTEEMVSWFERAGYARERLHGVGPQMFAPLELKPKKEALSGPLKIGLFCTTPIRKEFLVKIGKGEGLKIEQYYIDFGEVAVEIIQKVFKKDFKIVLKMKREEAPSRPDKVPYWNQKAQKEFGINEAYLIYKDPNANPWRVIDETDLVISIPFTSMSEAAWAMGKPSSFFDPSGQILPRSWDRVPLLSGADELYEWLCGIRDHRQNDSNPESRLRFGPLGVAKAVHDILNGHFGDTKTDSKDVLNKRSVYA